MELDGLNPAHCANHSVIDVDLGVGGRRLIVASGIAMPEWEIDTDETTLAEIRVDLRVEAGNIEQSSILVGLASIGNNDTDWVFATDTARLETAPTGNVILVVNLALMGESQLHRFAYQVVLTKRVVVSEISGVIFWSGELYRPATMSPSEIGEMITVMSHHRTYTPHTAGFAGGLESLSPAAPGEIVSVVVDADQYRAAYRVPNPPKGVELKVVVNRVNWGAIPGVGVDVYPKRPGTEVFTLSVADPTRQDVDFEISTVDSGVA